MYVCLCITCVILWRWIGGLESESWWGWDKGGVSTHWFQPHPWGGRFANTTLLCVLLHSVYPLTDHQPQGSEHWNLDYGHLKTWDIHFRMVGRRCRPHKTCRSRTRYSSVHSGWVVWLYKKKSVQLPIPTYVYNPCFSLLILWLFSYTFGFTSPNSQVFSSQHFPTFVLFSSSSVSITVDFDYQLTRYNMTITEGYSINRFHKKMLQYTQQLLLKNIKVVLIIDCIVFYLKLIGFILLLGWVPDGTAMQLVQQLWSCLERVKILLFTQSSGHLAMMMWSIRSGIRYLYTVW